MKKTLLVLLFLFSRTVIAKDFGTHGHVYPIKEINFLDQIQINLKEMERTGKIAKLQSELERKSFEKANRPRAVSGLSNTRIPKEWFYDPSVSLNHNLQDQNGRVFYYAGTKVNPLDKISLSKSLIFINGDDKKQITWALKQNHLKQNNTKIILVTGEVINLMKVHKLRFYFDQKGTLTKKLKITHVPAIVEQDGKKLKIKEVVI